MQTSKKLILLSHLNLVLTIILSVIISNAVLTTRLAVPAASLEKVRLVGNITTAITVVISYLFMSLIIKGLSYLVGETMTYKNAYIAYMISRYPVIFYLLVQVDYFLIKKQEINGAFSNYATILMVLFSQAIMYVYLDGKLNKKQYMIVNGVIFILLVVGPVFQIIRGF